MTTTPLAPLHRRDADAPARLTMARCTERPHRRFTPISLALALVIGLGLAGLGGPATSAAAPTVAVEMLGSAVIPWEALPVGTVTAYVVRETLPAGMTFDLPSGAPVRAADVTVQLGGTASMRWGSPVHLQHADGVSEEIPAETATTVVAGDVFMLPDAFTAKQVAVVGTEPVEWLDFYLTDNASPTDPFWVTYRAPEGYHGITIGTIHPADWAASGFGERPLAVTFRRTTVPADAAIATLPGDAAVLRYVDQGQATWSFTRVGGADPVEAHPVACPVGMAIPWIALHAGERIELANLEAEPTVLLEVELRPVLRWRPGSGPSAA